MGYTTDFYGEFKLSKKLTPEQKEYLETFSGTRRMKRDVNKLMEIYQGKHGIPDPKGNMPEDIYGREGEYFAYDDGNCGQTRDYSIVDYNTPPGQTGHDTTQDFSSRWNENQERIKSGTCQPGFWCQWTPNDEGNILAWDGGEKFYNYVEWLKYYIEHFFKRL